ncbi:MAG: hypothetical protein ACTHLZ_18055 [Tepidisphaeraceae bacterium]
MITSQMFSKWRRIAVTAVWVVASGAGAARAADVQGNAVIRAPAGGSDIVIRTTDRLAGAIDSLTWNGHEFINSSDHGRQLQSAAFFAETTGKLPISEVFNPTEAGSRDDGAGPHSSSRLLSIKAAGNTLQTTSRMAFWLSPGETSSGQSAINTSVLSNHRLTKTVRIGYEDLPHVIDYRVTFTVPQDERHTFAQFEALTGYMPPEFSRAWSLDAATGRLIVPAKPHGESSDPVILATPDGHYAMGCFSPDQPSPGFPHAGYGHFSFDRAKVVKWNVVFREKNPQGLRSGDRTFRLFVAVGTLDDVRTSLATLTKQTHTPHNEPRP